MKKISAVVAMFAVTAFAGAAFAAAPETVVLKSIKGDVTFGHTKHVVAGLLKDCMICHAEATGGKIGAMGKEKGHALCLDCHKKIGNAKAPTKCGECHKK
jgi:predicted CXXCH cytochrome family protein